jgi:phosphatidate cytidylyltransferase
VTRVLSGAVLVVVAVALVWFAQPFLFRAAAYVLLFLCVTELVHLARAGGLSVSMWLPVTGSLMTLAACGPVLSAGADSAAPLAIALMAQLFAIGAVAMADWSAGNRQVLASVAVSVFPSLYLALPLGAMVAMRETDGPDVLFLLMLTVMVSDTAQYYTGRLFGRRPLAPAISPKKTMEGAAGGLIVGTVIFVIAGAWWLARMPAGIRVLLGMAVVASGIAGDLFESLLKRSVGVKDSSSIIPGHGGVLDRVDALLFAAPVYYVVLRLL